MFNYREDLDTLNELVSALGQNNTVTTLDLSHNNIRDRGIELYVKIEAILLYFIFTLI